MKRKGKKKKSLILYTVSTVSTRWFVTRIMYWRPKKKKSKRVPRPSSLEYKNTKKETTATTTSAKALNLNSQS